MEKLHFASDYMDGAHPRVLEALVWTNGQKTPGYGTDDYSDLARDRIREACGCPEAEIHFLVGGTQANAVCLGALLAPYEGVLAAETGHVSQHEAGAIEFTGHEVLTLPGHDGKIDPAEAEAFCAAFFADENHDHMVFPGAVYVSQPTESGTLYSLAELEALREVCDRYGMRLYLDGARLAYALGCPECDVTLPDLGRLCDVFYIGGTKCGALFGEAVVVPKAGLIPHFFTIIKQRGALPAKGRILGLQFLALFSEGLYEEIGRTAVRAADRLRAALSAKGYELCYGSPTNQIFVRLPDERLRELAKQVEYSFWEKSGEDHTVIRLAVGWSTTEDDVRELEALL